MRKFGVSKEIEFDAGHRVPDHASKCRNPHGHRYKVRVTVSGPLQSEGSSKGMVLDFGDIKTALQTVHDRYDHGFLIFVGDKPMIECAQMETTFKWVMVDFVPTAENLAQSIYLDMRDMLTDLQAGIEVQWVEVFETPTSVAVFPWRG